MVAYSFKKSFVRPIRMGLLDPIPHDAKMQTIRSERKRHARAGERIQLYTAMRTKHCEKIIPDPICSRVDHGLQIMVETSEISMIRRTHFALRPASFDTFAVADGFANVEEMHAFWLKNHGPGLFTGVLIFWDPTTSVVEQAQQAA